MGTVCTTCKLDISYLVLYRFVICISQIKKKLWWQKFNLRRDVSITLKKTNWSMRIINVSLRGMLYSSSMSRKKCQQKINCGVMRRSHIWNRFLILIYHFKIILKEWHKAFILTWKSLLRTRNYYYFNMDLYLYEHDSIFISTTYDFTD